jgi:hypothetical protein
MDYTRIQIDSIGIGLSNIYNLDLTKDNFIKTYLAVGELYNESHNITLDNNNLNHIHNLVVTDKAVGVNTTRNNILSLPSKSLIVEGNIHCIGSITAESIILSEDIDISNNLTENIKTFNQVLNRISSHLVFYSVKDYLQNNIYTTHNVTIGNINNANHSTIPLKISRHCNNNVSNIQFVIQNNDGTNQIPTRLSCGIIGGVNNSPAHIITSKAMPLHFNISKSYNEIDNLYLKNDYRENTPDYTSYPYPSLSLDVNGSVLINLDKLTSEISYNIYNYDLLNGITIGNISEFPKLNVNGSLYADRIIIKDYITGGPKSLDSLYIRQGNAGGLSFYPNQIIGGNFNKSEFIFNSNVYIGNNENKYKLMIYGNSEITDNLNVNNNLITKNLILNNDLIVNGTGICDFNNNCFFSGSTYFNTLNCGNNITTSILNITDKFYYNGIEIQLSNLSNLGGSGNGTSTGTINNIANFTVNNSINIGGTTSNISDNNYNSEITNIYKYRDNQKNKFELYLHDSTITPYGSAAYIGHTKLNSLDNEFDNSLVILTQYNTTWNNIYFYAGKDKTKINNTPPNLGIFENNKIGINTIRPIKTLDINGDIITSNYYIRKNNIEYECDMIIKHNNHNHLSNLNINFNDFNDNNNQNQKQLNVIGGINSYDGYYEGNNKLCSIKYLNSSNAIIENANIGLGVQLNNDKITMSLQIQNTNINNNKINNSVITFYRSTDNSKYSGIEFCDDSTNINNVNKNKWYIYKNHVTDDEYYAGPLQFGYMRNNYKPKKSCLNLYYDNENDKYYIDINNSITYNNPIEFNKNKEDVRITGNVKITGDIDIDGSINIKGNYKFNDNNILFSPNPVETIISKIYSLGNNVYYFDTIVSPNHPKRISSVNSNLAYDTYINILDDKNNFNKDSNIKYAASNYILSSNNNKLNNIILDNIISYSNYIKTTSNNTNNYLSYINNISTEIINNYNFNNTYPSTSRDVNLLMDTASNNMIYSYSNFRLSSNIYDIIKDFYLTTITTSNNSLNLINSSINEIILIKNTSNEMVEAYNNIIHNVDINTIFKYGYSNLELSSNIYNDVLFYYNNISNISNQILIRNPNNSILSLAYNSTEIMYQDYKSSSNFYYDWNSKKGQLIDATYSSVVNNNKQIALNVSNNLDFLHNNLNIYYQFYNNVSNIIIPVNTKINNTSNLLLYNTSNTNNLYQILALPIRSYLDSALINSNISYSNYKLISNITNDTKSYIDKINDINLNSNVVDKFTDITYNLKLNLNENNNTNSIFYGNYYTTISSTPLYPLHNNTTSNKLYSLKTYDISSNIYNDIFYIDNFINNTLIVADKYKRLTNDYLTTSISTYNNLLNIYNNKNYIIDIDNIIKTGNSNKLLANNLYISSSNYYDNISNIKILTSNLYILSSNDMIYSSNNYFNCYNLDNIKSLETTPIYTLLSNNSNYAYDILVNTSNIYGNLYKNYPLLYPTLISTISYDGININNSNLGFNNTLLTSRIVNSINTNLDTYLEKSIINRNKAIKLDYEISSFDPDYSSNLLYYSTKNEITDGIGKIKYYIGDYLLNKFNNYKLNIITICNDYKYIFELNEELNDCYNNNIEILDYIIILIRDLNTDIDNIINNNNDISIENDIILELILHATNKYINLINNSYNFANSTTLLVEALFNYINIYINTSLSLISLLNYLIEFANTFLETSWNDISQNIVLFASLSYSVNASIKSIKQSTTTGQNTDVLIIGNNIKIYPTKSLIIGHDNDYSKWLETITYIDNYSNSAVYIYNNEYDSCASSFNCRTNKFISSFGNLLSLKSSASIDINLIDTLKKQTSSFNDSIIDGISLKISHIYHREDVNTILTSKDNSIFEIIRKNSIKSYFSCYTANEGKHILNIGGGEFYDINNNCINEDTVLHIKEDTSTNLLKLTNTSTNPILVSFEQNRVNNWQLSVSNICSYNYNSKNIFNITSNGIALNSMFNNSTMFINSFDNKPALELKNNYISTAPILKDVSINVSQKLKATYNENGIIYSKLNDIDTDYDISTNNFNYTSNISLDTISYTLSNVNISYNNISDRLPFTYNYINNSNIVNLLPILELNDTNINYNYDYNINYNLQSLKFNFADLSDISIYYYVPIAINPITQQTLTGNFGNEDITSDYIGKNGFDASRTKVFHTTLTIGNVNENDRNTILKVYQINEKINISNLITYNKYSSFNLPLLNIQLSNYKYNLVRLNNIIPSSLYNDNYKTTITKIQTNNNIIINNTVDYLKSFSGITSNLKTYIENKLKLYPIKINNYIYNIPINFTINDKYYLYENTDIILPIKYVNTSLKLPLIKQKNIYNNTHNIYSYTDDYEIYLNDSKLLNINSHGTLKTTGNIETNNIYLKGDIFNSDGISLYDNIISLINNISSTTNFELNTRNIILNPAIGFRDTYKGGILINGNNINDKNNNLFQINNFSDNDNFITLNSCTANSFIHFNNKITKIVNYDNKNFNSIYRVGLANETFGIWKYNLNDYDKNLFIDTNITTNYKNAVEINYKTDTDNFELNVNGSLFQNSDSRLKTDIRVIDNALNKLISLSGVTYSNIDSSSISKRQTGVIAQQVNLVLPEAVSINNDGYYNVAYGNLAGLIIESIKDLKSQIDVIKLRLNL